MIFDFLHSFGILFSVKQVFSIASSQLCYFHPRCFHHSTSTLSMPAAFPLLSAAIPFLYYGFYVLVVLDQNGATRGYGFVRFGEQSDQQEALKEMNDMLLGSKRIRVCTAQQKT